MIILALGARGYNHTHRSKKILLLIVRRHLCRVVVNLLLYSLFSGFLIECSLESFLLRICSLLPTLPSTSFFPALVAAVPSSGPSSMKPEGSSATSSKYSAVPFSGRGVDILPKKKRCYHVLRSHQNKHDQAKSKHIPDVFHGRLVPCVTTSESMRSTSFRAKATERILPTGPKCMHITIVAHVVASFRYLGTFTRQV